MSYAITSVYWNFYPRPPRGGRRDRCRNAQAGYRISIHALREEGDTLAEYPRAVNPISIHALREEGDSLGTVRKADGEGFLSTPSARRATFGAGGPLLRVVISIHALREEGDSLIHAGLSFTCDFYPRPPRGGRPFLKIVYCQ